MSKRSNLQRELTRCERDIKEELFIVEEIIKEMENKSVRNYRRVVRLPKSEYSEIFLKSNIIQKIASKDIRIEYRKTSFNDLDNFNPKDSYLLDILVLNNIKEKQGCDLDEIK